MADKMDTAAIDAALNGLDGWSRADGREAITKTYQFADFNAAFGWMARVALMIAGLVQGVLDQGKMEKRGDTLMGMPRPPLNLYHAPTQDERQAVKDDKKGLGPLARLVAPIRATTARAVYLEGQGA